MKTKPPVKPAAPPVPSSSSATKPTVPAAVRRKPMLYAGSAGVGLVALLALRGRAKAATGGGSALSMPATPGSPTYDSVASDVYNSMQPQIEDLYASQAALDERLTSALDVFDPASPAASPTTSGGSSSPSYSSPLVSFSGYGADPERPGKFAFLNPQGYRDLGDARNYPIPSAPAVS